MDRTSLNRLCDLDIMTVPDDIGFGFMPGASCFKLHGRHLFLTPINAGQTRL